jgi:5-enolpyruvylshikimate-3-phosphate synthase
VKECNRITGVVKNLSRCGIICKEFSDGLEIFGDEVRPSETKNLVMIKTYGDHRMAMAFAMLANYYYLKNHRF